MTTYELVERIGDIKAGDLAVVACTDRGDWTSRPRILPIRSLTPLGCGHLRLTMPRPDNSGKPRLSGVVEVTVRDDTPSIGDYCTCGAVPMYELSVTRPVIAPLLSRPVGQNVKV